MGLLAVHIYRARLSPEDFLFYLAWPSVILTVSFLKTHSVWGLESSLRVDLVNISVISRNLLSSLKKKKCIYFREREHEQKGQKEREREAQADSSLSVEPSTGLSLTTLRSPPEPKPRFWHLTNCATQTLQKLPSSMIHNHGLHGLKSLLTPC